MDKQKKRAFWVRLWTGWPSGQRSEVRANVADFNTTQVETSQRHRLQRGAKLVSSLFQKRQPLRGFHMSEEVKLGTPVKRWTWRLAARGPSSFPLQTNIRMNDGTALRTRMIQL